MKKLVLTVVGGLLLAATAMPQTLHQREILQRQRINRAQASGRLTRSQAAGLRRQERRTNRRIARQRATGRLTPNAYRRDQRALNRQSRRIFRSQSRRY